MKQGVRVLTCLLALFMLFGVMAGCKEEDENQDPEVQGSDFDVQTGEALAYLPETKNYEEYEFSVVSTHDYSTAFGYPTFVIGQEDANQSEISKAIYERANVMRDRYNVELRMRVMHDDWYEKLGASALSQIPFCDALNLHVTALMPAAAQGQVSNLYDYSHVFNFDASYWDQRVQEDLAVGDMLFVAAGDIGYGDEFGTLITLYNKQLWNDKGFVDTYGTPYQMVEDHTWTYTNMMDMIREYSTDLNSDGEMNEHDSWGMISELTAVYYFFIGSGLKIIDNSKGELNVCLNDPTQYELITSVLEETITIGDNPDIVIVNDPNPFEDMSNVRITETRMFSNNQALFDTYVLGSVMNYTDMKSDFGILPIPAYFDNQTEYYCWLNGGSVTAVWSMYRYSSDPMRAAEIMERLGYHSRHGNNTLYESIFERLKYIRVCRSEEDVKMFEIIIDSKAFDIDQGAAISGIEGIMYGLSKWDQSDRLHSTLESTSEVLQAKLSKWVMTLVNNNSPS